MIMKELLQNMRLIMDGRLIESMKSGAPTHRRSKFEAFVWLILAIKQGETKVIDGKENFSESWTGTYPKLAKIWHWGKNGVRVFIEELCRLKVIAKKKEGDNLIFYVHPDYYKNINKTSES